MLFRNKYYVVSGWSYGPELFLTCGHYFTTWMSSENQKAPDMPVIMITGSVSPEIPKFAIEAGISRVLPKTFNPADLLELVRSVTIGYR